MSNSVLVDRSGNFALDDPNCFNRLHCDLPLVKDAREGDYITFETRDAFDGQFDFDSTPEDVANCDLARVHPMTGPVRIEGAKRGDVLAVTIVDIEPLHYGYTVCVPGFGFLRDLFPDAYIANWKLDRLHARSAQIPGVAIPMMAFPGSIGVLPGREELEKALMREKALADAGGNVLLPDPTNAAPAALVGEGGQFAGEALRTIPPREFGGNMDIKEMQIGTTILFPVFIDGAGLWCGDVHYAQGDGEVCGTAVEMAARVTVKCEVRKNIGRTLPYPQFQGGAQLKQTEPVAFYAATGLPLKKAGEIPPHLQYLDSDKVAPLTNLSEDLTQATRDALIKIIDYMVETKGLTAQQAYVVAAACVDLRIGQLVDVPNYMVSAVLPLNVFE